MDELITQELTTVKAATDRMLSDVSQLVTEKPEGWETKLENIVDFSTTVSDSMDKIIYYTLDIIFHAWDDFPEAFRDKYNDNFYEFASRKTDGLAAGTITNYMSTARAFFGENKVEIFRSINVPVRDNAKNIVLDEDTGKPVTETLQWNPSVPSIAKLAVCAPLARSGELADNPELLTLLMDSGATVQDVKRTIYTGNGGSTFHYELIGGMIIASEEDWSCELAEIDWEVLVDEEAVKAMINMLSRLGIRVSAERLADLTAK